MYIAKQNINGKDYYYIRKSVRKGEKVISQNVAYGGKTREEAEDKLKELNKLDENKKINVDKKTDKFEIIKNIEKNITIEELANFCKAKGFVFPSSEIYGRIAGFWDFGPLGTELFNNLKQNWWNFFVRSRDNMVGIEASVISHPKTWEASGHLANFSDVAVVCKKCGKATKIDKSEIGKVKCESCSGDYEVKG